MALSNELGLLVLATGNKSGLATGYCTLYGDTCGAIAPLADPTASVDRGQTTNTAPTSVRA